MTKSIEQKQSEVCASMIDRRRLQIKKRMEEIKELQGRCPHYEITETKGADTGNWCKQDDCYWVDYKCNYCGKTWREEQ